MEVETLERSKLRQTIPFFWVTDMKRSLAFYTEQLGFEMKQSWRPDGAVRWCLLQRDDSQLMLQEFAPGRGPASELGAGLSIVFLCDDAIGLWREFQARGVDAKRPFVGNGLWVTEARDPDNYLLMFESPADAPEETVYEGD